MKLFRLINAPLIGLALLVISTGATAQTRLAIEAGPMIPFGDFGDVLDTSAWIGARLEMQNVNALGQVASASLVLQGGYSDLQLAEDIKDADASYWELGVGARVYSVALPFFINAGLNYFDASYDLLDAGTVVSVSSSGIAPTIGAGLNFGLGGIFVEVEGRLHFGFSDDAADPRFFTLTGALGLPF